MLPSFTQPDPDASLVAAARTGDARAFDALVCLHQSRLRRFVRARLDPAIDAEDVAQEVFVTAWRELGSFRGRSQFRTWLFGIALKQCAEAARRHLRLRLVLADLEDPEDGVPGPVWCSEILEWGPEATERVEVRQRLAELAEPERQVVELYYYADLNLREIAELLQVNLSTLKYRFYQAHRRLREALAAGSASSTDTPCGRARK